MSRAGRIGFLALPGMLVMAGCAMLGPSERQVQALQQRLEAIEARASRLEQSRSSGERAPVFQPEMSLSAESSVPPSGSKAGRIFRKGVRGGLNLVTGWVEIPKRVEETMRTSGAAKGVTWGLLRGFGQAAVRTAAGAYELVTFPIAAPAEYVPILQPEFVFQPDEPSS